MPVEEIVDELLGEVDYDLNNVAEDIKEIIEALKAGDEKKALRIAEDALALLEPQLPSDEEPSCIGLEVEKPKRRKTRGRKATKKKTKRK